MPIQTTRSHLKTDAGRWNYIRAWRCRTPTDEHGATLPRQAGTDDREWHWHTINRSYYLSVNAYGSTADGQSANFLSPIGRYGYVTSLCHRCIVLINDHCRGQWSQVWSFAIGIPSIASFQSQYGEKTTFADLHLSQ